MLAFVNLHKFYVSVTEIEYVEEKQSVQIITRIFIDDLEALLRKRYDKNITLEQLEDETQIDYYIQKYLSGKIQIKINNRLKQLVFVGKEYEEDIVYCYLEIVDVSNINTFNISNKVLFDLFDEQQNIIKTKIYLKKKNFMLIPQKNSKVLNFNGKS